MNKIVWEEPPPTNRYGDAEGRGGVWIERLTPLMKRPNKWARVREMKTLVQVSSAATTLRKQIVKRPPGRWEFAARRVDNKGVLYARYLGPEE